MPIGIQTISTKLKTLDRFLWPPRVGTLTADFTRNVLRICDNVFFTKDVTSVCLGLVFQFFVILSESAGLTHAINMLRSQWCKAFV